MAISFKHNLPKSIQFAQNLFATAALLALGLMLYRAKSVLSFHTPNHVVTSGYEEESLFALWKAAQGKAVYSDPHQFPFSASYFNWLFYWAYGHVLQLIQYLFQLSDAWLPTIGRLMTLTCCSIGFSLQCFFTQKYHKELSKRMNFAFSTLIWFGPLLGYWTLTVRPDVLGLLLESMAAWWFLSHSSNNAKHIALVGVLCFLAWSCKQTLVVTPGAIGLLLLLQRRWLALSILTVTYFMLVALTMVLAPEVMLKSLFFQGTSVKLSAAVLFANLINFASKSLPFIFLFVVLLTGVFRQKVAWRSIPQATQLSIMALFVWSVILLPASSKIGSAENYHFIALFYIILGAIGLYGQSSSAIRPWALLLSSVLAVLMLTMGLLRHHTEAIQAQQTFHQDLQQCIAQLPQPVFVDHLYGSLPWMNEEEHHFVLAYNYWADRSQGITFEHDGIGGLIENGYFQTLVLSSQTNQFDRVELNNYHLTDKSCAGFYVYQKS